MFAPGWLDHHIFNEHYANYEAFMFAVADALRDEYRAVIDAGFILQIDDPGVADAWDMIKPEPSIAEYRRHLKIRIDALNHALSGIPEDRVRHHFCWGSWHGAHTHDLPLKESSIWCSKCAHRPTVSRPATSVISTNGQCGRTSSWLAGKIIVPGVVSHATNIVEHPELVAQRIKTFADIVGRENVVAGTDCGLGGRLHDDLVWAKLSALAEGARLAKKALWGR